MVPGSKNWTIYANLSETFPQNPEQSPFTHFLIHVIRYNFRKTYEFREKFKCWFWVQNQPINTILGIIRISLNIQKRHFKLLLNTCHKV